jgi:hypothetical protein
MSDDIDDRPIYARTEQCTNPVNGPENQAKLEFDLNVTSTWTNGWRIV